MKLKKLPVIAAVCLSSMFSSLHSSGFTPEETKDGDQSPNFVIFIDAEEKGILQKTLDGLPEMQATHTKFGTGLRVRYPHSDAVILKNNLPLIDWKASYLDYNPVPFTAPVVKASVWAVEKPAKDAWADPENPTEIARQIAEGRKRVIPYAEGLMNPMGRTGIIQGELGLHGPNPAADPIVFCAINGALKVLLIKRVDNGEWAIPGGMLDPEDDNISVTATRELREETGLSFDDLKEHGITALGEIYQGYVDDPRNTDTSWMVTNAFAYLLDASALKEIKLQAADDAEDTNWVSVVEILTGEKPLFASHKSIIADGARKLLAVATIEEADSATAVTKLPSAKRLKIA